MPQGTPDYLALRIIDNNTGSEIVRDLPHAHQTEWQVRALQQGMPGSSTLGTFHIISPGAPSSPAFSGLALTLWQKLATKQRVEGYLGGNITGSPRFSGIITKLHKPLDAPWEIEGVDSLWMLQQSQVFPGEQVFAPIQGAAIVQSYSATQEVLWDDDFSGWSGSTHPNSSDYTGNGGFSPTTDPLFGLACLKATADGSFAVTQTTWTNAQFNTLNTPISTETASSVTIHGVIVAGTSTSNAGSAQIFLLEDATGQNGFLVSAQMAQTGASTGLYNVSVTIFSESAGTFTQQASVSNVFTNVPATFAYELTAVINVNTQATSNTLRVLINGKDPNCVFTGWSPAASGRVGIRMGVAAGGSPALYVNRLQFHSRPNQFAAAGAWGTNRFQAPTGNVQFSTISTNSTMPSAGQTHLDLLVSAMTFDGYQLRKDPGYGYKADALIYGQVGFFGAGFGFAADRSTQVVLEEGVNVIAQGTAVSTVPEMLGSDVRLNAVPGSDSGGSILWGRIGAAGDAVLTDTVADMGIAGFQLMVNYARQVQTRKDNPISAYQVHVARTPDILRVGGGAGPRELDFVTVHIPTLGVYRQKQQIMGYDFTEGSGEMTFYLNQLSAKAVPFHATQRVMRPLDFLGTKFQADPTR